MSMIVPALHTAGWAELDLAAAGDRTTLSEVLDALRDGSCRALVLTGEPAFAPEPQWLRSFELLPIPTLYAFEGELAGPAFDIALHCDIRLCSEAASLQVSGLGGRRLMRLVGPDAMVDLIRARGRVAASLALQSGLVNELTPAGHAVSRACEIAEVIASRGPIATSLATEAIWRGLEMPLTQALRFETDLTLLLQTTKDRAEGVAAFLEKRQPRFTGE